MTNDDQDPTQAGEYDAAPDGMQRVDIGALLQAIKAAYEKMGNRNTHKGLLVTAGSVIIHLVTEQAMLKHHLEEAGRENSLLIDSLEAAKEALRPLVTIA